MLVFKLKGLTWLNKVYFLFNKILLVHTVSYLEADAFLQADLHNLYCHNPTNNPKQLKTTFVGVVLLSVKKPPHHHHTTTTPPRVSLQLGQF